MASLKRKEQEQMLQASKKNEFTFLGSKKNSQLRINKIVEIPEDGNSQETPQQKEERVKSAHLPPIIFEECFVKDSDPHFVEVVTKAANELSE